MSPTAYGLRLFERIWEIKSKGRRNELRAVAAFDGDYDDVPDWFHGIRNGTPNEDRAGIDVVVTTDVGRIKVQIKSCESKARRFRHEQKKGAYAEDIVVVVMQETYTPEVVRRMVLLAVIPVYHDKIDDLAEEHGARFIPA